MNYAFHLPPTLIIIAVALDASCGDPTWFPHPVRLIGWTIAAGDRYLHTYDRRRDLIRGGLLVIAVIEGRARYSIRTLVGWDPETLDASGLIRATIESIAENSSDGIIAPLLFLVVAGPVGAVAYKAVNTLDSMIGYKSTRYLYFGRLAARFDDLVNLAPSRLTAISIALAAAIVTGRMSKSICTALTDGCKHESPNAGYPEAAMAGALGVELGGDAFYDGELVQHPRLG